MYETIIGLEIHVELKTKSKIFCSCSTLFGEEANTNTCPICLGFPGTMPKLNEEAVYLAVKAGLVLDCEINKVSKFDRKNYFYPDLPKGYQITQDDIPICKNGFIDIRTENGDKRIHIKRIHLEEDAGKLIHLEDEQLTLVDFNRAGVPLIEIVTEPDMRTPYEAVEFLKELKAILTYTEVSDCRMEQGSLRCDVNISVREKGIKGFGTKVEIKNLNSFKEIAKALKSEEERQMALLSQGQGDKIIQETSKWDNKKNTTVPMRAKENADDYMYFPEPDLPALIIEDETITKAKEDLPELPRQRMERYIDEYGLTEYESTLLTEDKILADYFEKVASFHVSPKLASNWILVELLRIMKTSKDEVVGREDNSSRATSIIPIKPEYLADLIKMIDKEELSSTAARVVFDEMAIGDKAPREIADEKNLFQINNVKELEQYVDSVIYENENIIQEYKAGSTKVIGFLMGKIMEKSNGRANPSKAKDILIDFILN